MQLARRGMPSPAFALKDRTTDPGVTNVRNSKSPRWHRWLGPGHCCLVPFTSFSEYDTVDGKKVSAWFAADEDRPLMAFAGIWTEWTSTRKRAEGEVTFSSAAMHPMLSSETLRSTLPRSTLAA